MLIQEVNHMWDQPKFLFMLQLVRKALDNTAKCVSDNEKPPGLEGSGEYQTYINIVKLTSL